MSSGTAHGATIRPARVDDAAACRDVYAPYVRDTVVSFETDVPTVPVVASRIAAAHAWWLAEQDGRVVGYAYGSPHRERAAYRWACDVSVYLAVDAPRRTGLGRSLYEVLFDALAARGFTTALAGVALPNDASLGLHRALGFETVGTYRAIGWKFDAWHDVCWLQRSLRADPVAPPREPS